MAKRVWAWGLGLVLWAAGPAVGLEAQTVQGDLDGTEGKLSDGSLYDIYEFEGKTGERVSVALESSDLDTLLLLVDSNIKLLNAAKGRHLSLVVTLPQDGRYRILVTSSKPGDKGAYTLRWQLATAAEVAQFQQPMAQGATDSPEKHEADRLLQQGIQQYQVSQFREALQSWEAALQLYRAIKDRRGEGASLGNLGLAYNSLGQYQKAIEFHQQSLAIKRDFGDRGGEANSLGSLGNAYFFLGQYQQAIDFSQQSLVIAREIGDRQGEANSLGNLSAAYNSLGQYQQAIDFSQQSLVIAREISDRQGEANSLGNLGAAYDSLGQYQRAIDFHQQSLVIAREIGDRQGEARSLGNLGNVYNSLGQYPKAIDFYQQSLVIAREIGYRSAEATIVGNLGAAYDSLGQYPKAIDFYQQSLAIAREIGDRQGKVNFLNNLGKAYNFLGQYPKAIDFLQQSQAIAREIGDRLGEATSLNNLGMIYFITNRLPESESALRASLAVYEAIQRDVGQNDRDRVSLLETQQYTYLNLQRTLIALNKIPEALEVADRSRARSLISFLREARPTNTSAFNLPNNPLVYVEYPQKSQHLSFQVIDHNKTILATKFKNDDSHEEVTRLIRFADENREAGKLELALNFLERALEIAHQMDNSETEIDVLSRMGSCYGGLGQFDRALSYFQQVLSLARKKGDRLNEAAALNMSGWAYAALEKNETAIKILEQALKIRQELDDRLGQVATLSGLGWMYINQGLYERALDYFEPALVISQEIKNLPMEGLILNSLGNIKLGMNQSQEALRKFELALNVFRKTDDRLGQGLALRGVGIAFKELGKLDQAEVSLKQAVEIHETLQYELKKDANKISIFEQQATTYLLLQNVLVDEHKTVSALEVADRSRARSLMSFLAQAKAQTQTDLSAAEMQAVARQQNGTIVLYSAIENELYIWVLPPAGEISFRRLPLPKDNSNLAQTAENLRNSAITTRLLASRGPESGAIAQLANQLRGGSSETTTFSTTSLRQGYDLLIKPIADLLPQTPAAKVIIVPHRELALVPFAALRDEQGNFLIDRYTLAIAPSVSVLAAAPQANPSTGQPLIIGNPSPMPDTLAPLPGAETEAKAIAQTLNATPLIGSQATETAIKAKIDQASLLHFATHGTIAQTAAGELESWLALAPGSNEDGKLTIAEIFDRRLSARLAVLSACDTGKGNVSGEGVVGLARAFLKAGIPTVVASLWKVPDQPTALMMQTFYAERATGKDAATALRSAMLTVRKQYPGPQNWAAFVAIGD